MARKAPRLSTVKRLFAFSGNRCGFPDCKEELVDDSGSVIGEICHIESVNENGPRFNIDSDDEVRRNFSNLILFCPRHHKIIDDHPEKYSEITLREFKNVHESKHIKENFKISNQVADQAVDNIRNQIKQIDIATDSGDIYVLHGNSIDFNQRGKSLSVNENASLKSSGEKVKKTM